MEMVQEYFGQHGNSTIRSMLYSYTKGISRIIADDKVEAGWTRQMLFYPVIINGLINKYEIPGNFLERCIQIQLPKKLPSEKVDDWVFSDILDDIGDDLRNPLISWAGEITREDIKKNRDHITKHLNANGINSRDVELFRPLCEYAYCAGDAAFEEIVDIAKYYVSNLDVKLTLSEQLLKDFHEAFSTHKVGFLTSEELCNLCKEDDGSIWIGYGSGLSPSHLPKLLSGYGIKSVREKTGSKRGFYAKQFAEPWKRVLGLDVPDTFDDIDGFVKMGRGLIRGHAPL
jgi:hypothetical protein